MWFGSGLSVGAELNWSPFGSHASRLPEQGTYILEIPVARTRTFSVGALGELEFPAGVYYYVGRALRGLPARLSRHCREKQRLRWHVDYLTKRVPVTRIWVYSPDRDLECALAGGLSRQFTVVPGFGASDCTCRGHLFHAPAPPESIPVEKCPVWEWRRT